jgi:hypothetical protein
MMWDVGNLMIEKLQISLNQLFNSENALQGITVRAFFMRHCKNKP